MLHLLRSVVGTKRTNRNVCCLSACGGKDGVIGPAFLWIAERFEVLRFRLMVKRGPHMRPQASEGEAQHDYFAGLDVSVKETSVCIVHPSGKLTGASPCRSDQGVCGDGQDPAVGDARNSHNRRSGDARAVRVLLARPMGSQGHAQGYYRQAPCRTRGHLGGQRLTDVGQEIWPRDKQTPEALAAQQRAEIEKWWPIIKAANIKAE